MWGTPPLVRATIGQPCQERTAKEVWHWLEKFQRPAFLWNVFPLHPHQPGKPLSNRVHTNAERDATLHFLRDLHNNLRPRLVVALGRDAQRVLTSLNIQHAPIRHPSMGGLNDFRLAMGRLLSKS